jgi:hypothetical protein
MAVSHRYIHFGVEISGNGLRRARFLMMIDRAARRSV